MIAADSHDIARRGEQLYRDSLKSRLEHAHHNDYVAIEPDSGEYFIAKTITEAIDAARNAHPDRIPFVLRIGHNATVHLGGHME